MTRQRQARLISMGVGELAKGDMKWCADKNCMSLRLSLCTPRCTYVFSLVCHSEQSKNVFYPPIDLPTLCAILIDYVFLVMLPLPPRCTQFFLVLNGQISTIYHFQAFVLALMFSIICRCRRLCLENSSVVIRGVTLSLSLNPYICIFICIYI